MQKIPIKLVLTFSGSNIPVMTLKFMPGGYVKNSLSQQILYGHIINFKYMQQLYNKLGIRNATFCNIRTNKDLYLFIDPYLLGKHEIGRNIKFRCEIFFKNLINALHNKDYKQAEYLLSGLHESKNTSSMIHLGYSTSASGKAVGEGKGKELLKSLIESTAVKNNLLNQIEDASILIPGVSKDIISDLIANIGGPELIQYSIQSYIEKGGKDLVLERIKYFDIDTLKWTTGIFQVPKLNGKGIILIPKQVVSRNPIGSIAGFIRHGIMPHMQEMLLGEKSILCETGKGGVLKKPKKKSLYKHFSFDKNKAIDYASENPESYERYKKRLR